MHLVKKFAREDLAYEYGLDGIRTFPWEGIEPPFAGAYCIVRPGTATRDHVNSPSDEDEMFITVQGEAVVLIDGEEHPVSQGDIVMIPRGASHHVRNEGDQPFHFYTVWWNRGNVDAYLAREIAAGTK